MTPVPPRPDWLAAAAPVPVARPEASRPAAGDIRRADAMDRNGPDSRLVLVMSTDDSTGTAAVTLLSPEVDMAASADVVLAREKTGLTYPLLAETDVQAPLWFVQLGPALARIDPARLGEPDATPLLDELDARWAWKENELDALHALAGECLRQSVDGPGPALVDPQCLDPGALARDDLLNVVLKAADLARAGVAIVPVWTLIADESMPPALDTWRAHGDVDLLEFLAGVLAFGGGEYSHRPAGPPVWHIDGRRPVDDDPLAAVLADQVAQGCRSVQLVTASVLWDASAVAGRSAGDVLTATVGDARCQIIWRPVDAQEERVG